MRHESGQSVNLKRSARAAGLLVAALAGFVVCPVASAQGVPETGFKIMAAMGAGNCLACHNLPRQTGTASTLGPSLNQVGTRYNTNELRQWVTDARQIKPDTLMPPFGTTNGTTAPNQAKPILNAEEIAHVVAALQTLR